MRKPIYRRFQLLFLALLAALLLETNTHAESFRYTLMTFDAPGSVFGTHATGINNRGSVVGYYEDAQGAHGFLRDPMGSLSAIEVPGATGTVPQGINDYGVISGLYYANGGSYGFIRDSHQLYTSFSVPGESRPATAGFGINNNGEIIAYSQAPGGPSWVRSPDGSIYSMTNIPGSTFNIGRGINDLGATVGAAAGGSLLNTAPYLMEGDHLRYSLLTIPGATQDARAYGINNHGVIVGMGSSSTGQIPFVRYSEGSFDFIQVSGEIFQEVNGLNDHGWIVGFVSDTRGAHAFILKPVSDTTPPVTTATLSPDTVPNGWNTTNVTIEMKATDDIEGSGINQIQFGLGGFPNTHWQTVVGEAATVAITAEGSTVLTYFATDNAGNVEAAKSLVVRIDKAGPVSTAAASPAPNSRGWNNSSVAVAFAGADSVSGTASCTAPASLTAEGANQKVSGFCTDRAGNRGEAVNAIVSIDRTPPLFNGMPARGCTLWPPNGKLVQVATVSAADPLSGIHPGSFRLTAVSSEPSFGRDPDIVIAPTRDGAFTVQLRAERSGRSDRVYTLFATATDVAGNLASATATCVVPHDQGK